MTSPIKIWRNQKDLASLIGRKGKIVSWTTIRNPPAEFKNQTPYYVALVKLENGMSITAQITDCDENEPKIGQKVETIIRRTVPAKSEDIISYGIKVRLLYTN